MSEKILILDANSILYRAFYALPKLTTSTGQPINAVYGFLLVLFRVIKEFSPDYIFICFDFPAKTFRHQLFKEYKSKRPPTPDDLKIQIPILKEILKTFSIPFYEKEGFEADDIIGTITKQIAELQNSRPKVQNEKDLETIIVSGDLDALQLVGPQIKVYVLQRGVKDIVLYDENLVKEKFQGLAPEQILDFKALRGDPSDNIPGINGIGEKTAINLLLQFKNLENLYKEIEENSQAAQKLSQKLKEILLKQKEQAFLSKDLAKIEKNIPLEFNLIKWNFQETSQEKVKNILLKYGFKSLTKKLPEIKKQINNGRLF